MRGNRRFVFSGPEVALSLVALVTVSVALYGGLWLVDFGPGGQLPWDLFADPQAVNTMSNLGEVTVGTLGVALTVVTIIVELASNRYTPRITELFIRDPVNALMMGFFVVTAVLVLWVDMSLYGDHVPRWMILVTVGAMTSSMLALLPYFGYVFDFLLPTRVVHRIQQRSSAAIRRVSRQGPAAIGHARDEVQTAIEQLGDIALNSVGQKDKGISIAALNALTDLAEANLECKPRLPDAWFDTEALLHGDQDFVAMHPDMVRGLYRKRTWVDMKILRQYQAAFEESLIKMRDISHLIAILTRRVAHTAAKNHDATGLDLAVRFLNTYMRATLNNHDVRTAYNLMNEYRALGEHLVALGYVDEVVSLGERFKFYGQLALKMGMPFILETAAYDLCALIERAHGGGSAAHDALLAIFLEVDRSADHDSTVDASLRGVRKAQAKLATWYLQRDEVALARRIFDDMRAEPLMRLRAIHAELRAITEPEWWEVSDRGVNFEYLPPERRERLDEFFGWFEVTQGLQGAPPGAVSR